MSKSYRNRPYKPKEKAVKSFKESKVALKNKVMRGLIEEDDIMK